MSKSILLVDDEPLIREVVEHSLKKHFSQFFHASHGVEALALLKDNPGIDVILSDLRMPVMDGVTFIREARGQGFNQPFLFFTSFANRQTLNDVVMYGVQGFIEKGKMQGLEEAVLASLNEDTTTLEDLKKQMDEF